MRGSRNDTFRKRVGISELHQMLFGNTDVSVFGIGMVGNLISDVPGVSYVDGGDFFLDFDMG